MADIELTFGNNTTRGQGSITLVALYKRTTKDKQQPISMAVKDSKADVKTLGLVDSKTSSSNNRPGFWTKTRVKMPEGSFLEMQMMRTAAPGRGFGGTTAFIIRARSDGPLYRIAIDLPTDEWSTESKAYIEGRFDILTLEEIEVLGVNCDRKLETYDPAEYEDDVTVEVLEREFRSKTKIKQATIKASPVSSKDGSGGSKRVLKIKRIRRLNAGG